MVIGREGSLSILCQLWVACSRECQNLSWSWLPLLQAWDSLTMTFVGKFIYICIYIYIYMYIYMYMICKINVTLFDVT